MKKIVAVAILGIAVLAIVGVIVIRGISAKGVPAAHTASEVSPHSARSLQMKIDALKRANKNPDRHRGATRVGLSEAEWEYYVLYSVTDDIPAQLDPIDVKLAPATV